MRIHEFRGTRAREHGRSSWPGGEAARRATATGLVDGRNKSVGIVEEVVEEKAYGGRLGKIRKWGASGGGLGIKAKKTL